MTSIKSLQTKGLISSTDQMQRTRARAHARLHIQVMDEVAKRALSAKRRRRRTNAARFRAVRWQLSKPKHASRRKTLCC